MFIPGPRSARRAAAVDTRIDGDGGDGEAEGGGGDGEADGGGGDGEAEGGGGDGEAEGGAAGGLGPVRAYTRVIMLEHDLDDEP